METQIHVIQYIKLKFTVVTYGRYYAGFSVSKLALQYTLYHDHHPSLSFGTFHPFNLGLFPHKFFLFLACKVTSS